MSATIQAYPLASLLVAFVVGGWCGMFAICIFKFSGEQ